MTHLGETYDEAFRGPGVTLVSTTEAVDCRRVIVGGVTLYATPDAAETDVLRATHAVIDSHKAGQRVTALSLEGGPEHRLEVRSRAR